MTNQATATEVKLTPGECDLTIHLDKRMIEEIGRLILPCTDKSKYANGLLKCVNFKLTAPSEAKYGYKLEVAATDGSRLAHTTYTVNRFGAHEADFNIPGDALMKLTAKKKAELVDGALITLDLEAKAFHIRLNNLTIVAAGQLETRDYPRYASLFPKDYKQSVTIDNVKSATRYGSHTPIDRLVETLKQIEKASYKPETKKDNAKHGIATLNFSANEKTPYHAEVTVGMVHDLFSCNSTMLINDDEYITDRIKIAFCSKFLIEALNHDGWVTMNYNGELKPVVFTYCGSNVRYLLMPIKNC